MTRKLPTDPDRPIAGIIVRQYRPDDAHSTRDVFDRAIRGTAAHFYDPAQIEAWAQGGDVDLASWNERRERAWTIVAESEGRIVGFADLCDGGLLDMLFVHPDAGGRGVTRALVSAVLDHDRRNGVPQVTTYASRAARAVFERLGFVVDRENSENQVRGVFVPNCEMHIDLTEDEDQLIVATHPSVPESDMAPTLSPRSGDAATTEPSDLSALRVKDLLQLEAAIVSELRGRGLVRTNNKPLGDIAEQIVLAARGGVLEPNSTKSHDVTSLDGRSIQVKAMGARKVGRAGTFSPFRSFGFDAAVFLVFAAETFEIVVAREVPDADIEAATRCIPHINGRQPTLRQIEPLGDDVTEGMRAAYAALDAVARA